MPYKEIFQTWQSYNQPLLIRTSHKTIPPLVHRSVHFIILKICQFIVTHYQVQSGTRTIGKQKKSGVESRGTAVRSPELTINQWCLLVLCVGISTIFFWHNRYILLKKISNVFIKLDRDSNPKKYFLCTKYSVRNRFILWMEFGMYLNLIYQCYQ